jgi:phosphatidylethanolamine-binding protein (PEBP) family uncharacterized protein
MRNLVICSLLFILASMSGCDRTTGNLSSAASFTCTVVTPQNQDAEPSEGSPVVESGNFSLSSPEVIEGGMLPKEYTCDGNSSTLPLVWHGEPTGTACFALVMYTIPAPEECHWYWVLFDIPSNVHSLEKNSTKVGVLGNNSVNRRTEYAPPCSQGPGPKLYTFTLYALSAAAEFPVPASEVTRDVLLSAIRDITLARADLNVYYSR